MSWTYTFIINSLKQYVAKKKNNMNLNKIKKIKHCPNLT